MTVENDTQNFAEAVRAQLELEKEEQIKLLESTLPEAQRLYDANLTTTEQLGIIQAFREAAVAHRDITKKRARVDISPRPTNFSGDSTVAVKFLWEVVDPKSDSTEVDSIEVKVIGGTFVLVGNEETDLHFLVEDLNSKSINRILIEAYNNPRKQIGIEIS